MSDGQPANEATRSSGHLIDRAIEGDHEALARLLKAHGPQVRSRLAGRIGRRYRSALDEDDVMQVTYVEAFMRIRRFRPDAGGGFTAWLSTIAENNLQDALRELNRKKRPPPGKRVNAHAARDSYVSLIAAVSAGTPSPSRAVALDEAKDLIDKALSFLPQDYRQVLLLYHFEDLSADEVARRMHRSPGAVYMLRARAIEHLRQRLPTASHFFTRSP